MQVWCPPREDLKANLGGSKGDTSACGAPVSLAHSCIQIPRGDHGNIAKGNLVSVPSLRLLVALAPGQPTAASPFPLPQWEKLTWFSRVFMFMAGAHFLLAGYYLGLGN